MSVRQSQSSNKVVFIDETEIEAILHDMELDQTMNTKPLYVKSEESPDVTISFYKRHTDYLKGHPKVNPEHYLSNLRTMIKIRV
ncbi:MAG: hypothetical protein ABIQ89_01005 [Candidatus Saccharimonadales bacterium]